MMQFCFYLIPKFVYSQRQQHPYIILTNPILYDIQEKKTSISFATEFLFIILKRNLFARLLRVPIV